MQVTILYKDSLPSYCCDDLKMETNVHAIYHNERRAEREGIPN